MAYLRGFISGRLHRRSRSAMLICVTRRMGTRVSQRRKAPLLTHRGDINKTPGFEANARLHRHNTLMLTAA